MNIALVDDQQNYLDALRDTLVSALSELGLTAQSIACFESGESFLADMKADKYDIIILDIYMDNLNGIDVARKIREKDENVTIAFCTSSNEFAGESYEVDAKYYLQKPVSKDKVAAMLKRFNLASIERNRIIRLPDGFRVPLRHIIYTDYINHSVEFHIRGQKPHVLRANQAAVEALLLNHKGFSVINKGCIVNFAQVRSIDASSFVMQNGEAVPIARRRFKETEAAYTAYLFEKMDEEVGG